MESKWKYVPHLVFLTVGGMMLYGCGEENSHSLKSNATDTPDPNIAQIDDSSNLIDTTIYTPTPNLTSELPLIQPSASYIVPTSTLPIPDTPIVLPRETPTSTVTNTPTLTSTPLPPLSSSDISGTTQAQVGGTISAWTRTPESYAVEMDRLPENLSRSAVVVTFVFDDGSVSGGSGALIGYDTETGIAYGVTAAHLINNSQISDLIIAQPHINPQSSVEVHNSDFSTVWQSPEGLCVFAFRHPDAFRLGRLGEENVDINWIPDPDEDLFSLGFPSYIDNGTSEKFRSTGFPAVHHVISEGFYDESIHAWVYRTDGQGAIGSSGTVIENANGKFVGIVLAVSVDNSFIYPLDEWYFEMVNLAVENLESK